MNDKNSILETLGCENCGSKPMSIPSQTEIACQTCNRRWSIGPKGCINSLTSPSPSVLNEINGMMNEHSGKFKDINDFLFQKKESISKLADRIQASDLEGLPKNYFRSTLQNFEYAFSRLKISGKEKVLEIGAEHDCPFLSRFSDKGCECFATNLFFTYEDGKKPQANPIIADMNDLPFRNNTFDVVLMSATSHHSPNLPGLFQELSRVTKPGGILLMLNEPTYGVLKHSLDWIGLGTKKGGNRNHSINENEYSAFQYTKLGNMSGFKIRESFFSVYYDNKLRSGDVSGVRFTPLAKVASSLWKWNIFRKLITTWLLFPLQQLIGLELNAIYTKIR